MSKKISLKEDMKKVGATRCEVVRVIKENAIDSETIKEYNLSSVGRVLLPKNLKRVEVLSLNKFYEGIGMSNINGGMEFYANNLPQSPITIGEHGIIHITRFNELLSKNCCVFDNFIDYLSFLKMTSDLPAKEQSICDIIIVGSVTNFSEVIKLSEKYKTVNCYFPFSVYGRVMFQTFKDKFGDKVSDSSKIFAGYKYLSEYVTENLGKV